MERGGRRFEWATRLEDRERLWQARHNAHYAGLALRPGCRSWATDVCVPISRLADCVVETEKETRHASFPVCLVGHAGDGNFHLMYLLNPDDPAEVAEARLLNEQLVARALALGGTCTGEHGVGFGKIKYMKAEHGDAVGVMRGDQARARPRQPDEPGQGPPVRRGRIRCPLILET